MGRAWGTNLFPANPFVLTAGSPVACPAGTATVVLDSGASPLIIAGASGGFYLFADLQLAILLGATAPTALVVSLNLVTAGAGQDTYTVPPALLVNGATIVIGPTLFVPNSGSIWFPTGDRIQLTVNPTAQAVTVQSVGTRATCALYQGT